VKPASRSQKLTCSKTCRCMPNPGGQGTRNTKMNTFNHSLFRLSFLALLSISTNCSFGPMGLDRRCPTVLSDAVSFAPEQMIACAYSAIEELDGDAASTLQVLFLRKPAALEGRHYLLRCDPQNDGARCEGPDRYCADEKIANDAWGGAMGVIHLDDLAVELEINYFVAAETDTGIHISNPIVAQPASRPTRFDTDFLRVIDTTLTPSFAWNLAHVTERDLVFLVISSGTTGDMYTGVHTQRGGWTYPDTSGLVMWVHEPPPPELISGEIYEIAALIVGKDDGWVSLVDRDSFVVRP